jgi:hypothetical protein
MGRRGGNLFKRNDGLRALKIARDGGIEPAMIEIVAKDGTIFRVYGDNAALTETTQDCVARSSNDSARSTATCCSRRCRRHSSLHCSTQCHRMRRSIG